LEPIAAGMVVELVEAIIVIGADYLQVVLQGMRHRRKETKLQKARIEELRG
jgi:hypothetical protein